MQWVNVRRQIYSKTVQVAAPQEKPEAIAYLDFAIAEFRDMKMQPSLERALRHKEILKA